MSRLETYHKETVVPQLQKALTLDNIMDVP